MIDFTGWKYYQFNGVNIGITITNNDVEQSCLLTDPDVIAWIDAGNTPLPTNEELA